MAHLVQGFSRLDPPLPLPEWLRLVRAAHDYLARQAMLALDEAGQLEQTSDWGARVKRLQVTLDEVDRPKLVFPIRHNLFEVVNQCATIERLIDCMEWALTPEAALADFAVETCHPTTSSARVPNRPDVIDNDLVLKHPNGQRARFEISDVVSDKVDSNGKLKKDLEHLGVTVPPKIDPVTPAPISGHRLFLVVSQEFSKLLEHKKAAHFVLTHVKRHGSTRIFEIEISG